MNQRDFALDEPANEHLLGIGDSPEANASSEVAHLLMTLSEGLDRSGRS